MAGVRQAIASLDRGESVSHEAVKHWIASWGRREREADPKALMTPIWPPEVIDDLAALREHIEQDDPVAAQH